MINGTIAHKFIGKKRSHVKVITYTRAIYSLVIPSKQKSTILRFESHFLDEIDLRSSLFTCTRMFKQNRLKFVIDNF